MPPTHPETPPGAGQRHEKSHKRTTQAKRESHRPNKSTARVIKTETDQDAENKSAPNAKQGIFARFMRQAAVEPSQETRIPSNNDGQHRDQEATASKSSDRVAQQSVSSSAADSIQSTPLEGSLNRLGVAKCSNESDTVVKTEDSCMPETNEIQSSVPQETDEVDETKTIVKIAEQDHGDIAVPQSSTKSGAADFQQAQGNDHSPRQLPSQEEKGRSAGEESFQDGASKNGTEAVECDGVKDADQSTVSAHTMDTVEKSHRKSRKKRKHKHSNKRSKSSSRSKSPKRRKISESFVPNFERERAKGHGNKEQPTSEFDAEQARARIPKGCSFRHEGDQKEELRDGKKIVKSKKFKKMLRSTLEDLQVTTMSWMVTREKDGQQKARGGIIALEMGLGKTVTSLACIAANKLPKKDRKKTCQATLVVVPNRKVANQWVEEAKKHWHEEASSLVTVYTEGAHHATQQYEKQWIVLATYGQIRNHFPKAQVMEALHDQYADDRVALQREFQKLAKDLFRIKWFRVILDEGHGITKWNGRTLEACTRIQAERRWVLSGTPIQNEAIEFYSYATFICCEFLGKRRVFRNEYIVEDATNDDFDTVGSTLIYRGTADEKLKIPPTAHREVYVEISQEEEMICKAINEFFKVHEDEHKKKKEDAEMPIFEDEQDEGEVEDIKPEEEEENPDQKNEESRTLPSWQLRIRQALSHPYCLQKFLMGKYLSEDQLTTLASDLKSISEKKTVIEQLEADEEWGEHLGQYQIGLNQLKSRKEAFLGGFFDMNEIMDLVLLQHTVNQQKCGGTACESQDLSRFKCGHLYCGSCLGRLMTETSNLPEAERSGYIKCSTDGCGEDLLFGKPVTTLEMLAAKANRDKGYVEIGRDSINSTMQTRLEKCPFFIASSYGPRIAPPPSSRLTATMAVAMTWLTEAPRDKIIIFTQFIPTQKMLGCQLEALGIKFVYYSGALSRQKQEDAMNAFKNDPETMVMVATMKSGGQSHNLTVANRVIIVDLWWNKAAEKQAISRVARMGQTKETYSVRIVTKHSMDDHVIEVQTDKEAMVARLLQDDGHVCIEVDDKRLEEIFKPKEGDQARSIKRKRKDETPEECASVGMGVSGVESDEN